MMKYAHKHSSVWQVLAHLFHPRRSNNHRARLLHPEGFLVLGAIAVLCFGILNYPTSVQQDLGLVLGYASDISVDQVIAHTNRQRQTAGLGAVTENSVLAQAAQAKAADMFAKQYWAHTSPVGKEPWDFMREAGYRYRRAGENLARDFMVTPDMVAAWMASPTHRANIMNGGFTQIGVAVMNGSLDGVETTLVVQMFGTPPVTAQTTDQAVAQVSQEAIQVEAAPVSVPLESPRPTETVSDQENNQSETVAIIQQPAVVENNTVPPVVLAGQAVPVGSVQPKILYSPLHIAKAVSLAIAILIVVTLVYDGIAAYSQRTIRFVGKNLAHLCLFLTVVFIVLFFKGGVIQ